MILKDGKETTEISIGFIKMIKITFCKKIVLPHRQIKYPVDFDDELKTRKRQIR